MKLKLIAVGTKMPGWVTSGYEEYARRFPRDLPLELIEIPAGKRTKSQDVARLTEAEGEQMLAAAGRAHIVTLEVSGSPWTTHELSRQLARWQQDGRDVALLVGGPEGLSPACVAASAQRWSLSPLTLPHPLVRVVLAESLYRAHSLLINHPYHRE